ncbi:hypothetical protein [Ectothiorhodospira variabilis]|uniref:hypothetical protein n=1 Tax=Ectothiorhodospira variabilis TaxID=505694 RepID=UPI001EFAC1C3|nr:hypothetical protein [Ectothiorhodospira variabilis]MCG5493813.1 hypothetical protein [Ectothiorhodospira variabilis]MCG5497905.1 hypothetical protein [Ectothiorhodospira variabilis]MCG5504012.1 hypothetical protein [Ectothiorhodospira variabilis]MCG5507167.1 hypothetical protein [Ectothiorhodospira variabilis]
MLSVNDLKGLLEVNRIATLPFIVAAYFQEFGFSHFPGWVPTDHGVVSVIAFMVLVVAAFLASWAAFGLLNYLDYKLGRFQGVLWSFATVTLLSFAVLGLFIAGDGTSIHMSWFVAAGAGGLYLLDVKRKTDAEIARKTT